MFQSLLELSGNKATLGDHQHTLASCSTLIMPHVTLVKSALLGPNCLGKGGWSRTQTAALCLKSCAKPRRSVSCMTGNLRRSFESDDELDAEIAEELNNVHDPNRFKKLQERLDLIWRIGRSKRPETCQDCQGEKSKECNWCHGTGVLMIGDQLFCSLSTHSSSCPVCRGQGYVPCQECRGTGKRAKWLNTDPKPSN